MAILSAVLIVDSLWAMTMQVRPFLASSRADWTIYKKTNLYNEHSHFKEGVCDVVMISYIIKTVWYRL